MNDECTVWQVTHEDAPLDPASREEKKGHRYSLQAAVYSSEQVRSVNAKSSCVSAPGIHRMYQSTIVLNSLYLSLNARPSTDTNNPGVQRLSSISCSDWWKAGGQVAAHFVKLRDLTVVLLVLVVDLQ